MTFRITRNDGQWKLVDADSAQAAAEAVAPDFANTPQGYEGPAEGATETFVRAEQGLVPGEFFLLFKDMQGWHRATVITVRTQ